MFCFVLFCFYIKFNPVDLHLNQKLIYIIMKKRVLLFVMVFIGFLAITGLSASSTSDARGTCNGTSVGRCIAVCKHCARMYAAKNAFRSGPGVLTRCSTCGAIEETSFPYEEEDFE